MVHGFQLPVSMEHSGSYRSLRFLWEYQCLVWTKCTSDLCRHSGLCKFFPFNFYVVDLFITSSVIGHDDRLSAILCRGAPKHQVQQSMPAFCTLSLYKAATWRLQTWAVHVCLCVCVRARVFTSAETQGSGWAHIVCVHLVPTSCCLHMYISMRIYIAGM